ncbi:MAG: hypothetical protein IKO17_01080 [Prevotella sp.]|nr:hypothetical protein [Prevotella sp.]
MKNIHYFHITKYKRLVLFLHLLLILSLPIKSQITGDPFDVNVEIKMLNEETNKYEIRGFKYGLIENEANANKILKKAESLAGKELEKFLNNNEVTTAVSVNSQGRFKRKVLAGMAIVAIIPMEAKGIVIPIRSGQTNLTGTIKYHALEGADVKGKQTTKKEILPEPPDDDGDSITFNIKYILDAKWAKKDTRVIIQIYMVDCDTQDTMAYCPPIIYEGTEYHALQNKRMGYNYDKNDSLSIGYNDDRVIIPGQETIITASVPMKKPNHKKMYKGPYRVSVEDYHHVYFQEFIEGDCLQINPFKLMDFTPALGELELSEEFKEPAQSQFGEAKKALNLRYDVGKFEFIDDSLNRATLNDIIEELNSYGKYLIHYDIEGFASPDGTYKKNEELARKRADNAVQAISRGVTAKVTKPRVSVKVCTWDEVVEELNRRGKTEIAEAIKGIIQTNKNENAVYAAVKALPDYQELVVPVLESQRKMNCSVMFRRPHILNEQEVVEQYFHDKKVPEKDRFSFSEGDYFNLLANLDSKKDSADLDSVTIMAYNYCKSSSDFLTLKLSPYVANRMAMIQIKRGNPDKNILEPFLDYSRSQVDGTKGIDEINTMIVNRKSHVLNQAVAYYMDEKLDTAKYWLNLIKNTGMPGAIALDRIIELRKNYKKEEKLSLAGGEKWEEYKRAKKFVLNSSEDNKAILYTEISKWNKRLEAEDYVNVMSDDNPRKWYLKGILWANEDRIKAAGANNAMEEIDEIESAGMSNFKELTKEEYDMLSPGRQLLYQDDLKRWKEEQEKRSKLENDEDANIDVKGIPYYLAYFQHAFDLDPNMKKFYYKDGQVISKLRRTYKYKHNKIPAYRKLFKQLKLTDDIAKEASKSKIEEMNALE